MPPAQKALFDDLKKFAEDQEEETGTCTPLDTLITTHVNTRYPRIPSTVAASIVKPEEGAEDLPAYQLEEGTSNKALVTAIFPSTDPAVLSYNMKGTAAECTDADYDSVHDVSDTEELDSTEIAQIWHDMVKLKRDEAALYDKLALAAPLMMQSDLLFSVEKTPKPSSHLPDCVEEMYSRIADPQKFRVALAAGERLMNIYRRNREDVKPEPIEITAHRFEVRKKDIYELLRGDKYVKPSKKRKASLDIDEPSTKQFKEEVPKQACRIVTTLLSPPSIEDQAAAGPSTK